LFLCDSMCEWWWKVGRSIYADGLLRAVAQINWGVQTEATVELARGWLSQRLGHDTGDIFMELAHKAYPLTLVEKSPFTVYCVENMQRARWVFPRAKFLHLVRHPLGYGKSMAKVATRTGVAPTMYGLLDYGAIPPTLDPQMQWYRVNTNILTFLATISPE